MTLLHYACHHGDLDMIQTLLAAGSDPDVKVTKDAGVFKVGMRPIDCVKVTRKRQKENHRCIEKGQQRRSQIPDESLG
ncbi:ankyrin repeat domain-containing protein [Leptospira kirschneri]|uniref:ankyrin repeat domain-containing protein n=1 Tax=Leptospira kirschneri TaxID=29507 RepID=UPI0009B7933C|nr:ankyrin repeat domain-containing protein [Leptospira kirschneri]